MEGTYYLCGWRFLNSRFEVWTLRNPKIKAKGITFAEADESLGDQICERYDDGENKREYIPSPPLKTGRKVFLVNVWGDTSIDAIDGNELFSNGRCSKCKAILGSRTSGAIKIDKLPRQRNGFFVSHGHVMHVFSLNFINLIETVSGISLQWRKIDHSKGEEWLELVAGNFVRGVVPKNRNLSGWRCSSCGISRILAYRDPEGILSHVAASDFKKDVPGIFAIKHLRGVSLGMTNEIWSQVKLKAEAKGLMSQAVGLILDEDISDLSKLRNYEDYQADPYPVES